MTVDIEVIHVADYWRVRLNGRLVSSHYRKKEADKAARELRKQASASPAPTPAAP